MSSCRVESAWNLGADYQLPKGLHLGGDVGYSHAYVEHVSKNSHWNALHLAIPVKAYYDLCPHLSIYAKAEYKVLFFKHSEAPRGLLTASIGLRFHLGAK